MRKIIAILFVLASSFAQAEQAEPLRLGTSSGQVQSPKGGKVDFTGIPVLGLPGATTPTGTGFRHITLGIEDAAAQLVTDADVASNAAISESKIANLVGDLNARLTSVPVSRTIFVDLAGNDISGAAGDEAHPVATISKAITLTATLTPTLSNPVLIRPGIGTFIEDGGIILPANVSIDGRGKGVTIIQSAANEVTVGVILVPGNNSIVSNLTIYGPSSTVNQACIGNWGARANPDFTNATLLNVETRVDTDAVVLWPAVASNLKAFNCVFGSKWDSISATVGGYGEFYNCVANAAGPSFRPSSQSRGVANAGGTILWFGGSITASNAVARTAAVETNIGATTANTEIYNARLSASGGTSTFDLFNGAGRLAVNNCVRSDGAALVTSGTITQLSRYAVRDKNLSDLIDFAAARSNLGLGGAAVLNVGTITGTVAAGDDSRFTDDRVANALRTATSKPISTSTDPTNGQALVFNTTTGNWEPTTLASGGNVSGSSLTLDNVIAGNGGATIKDGGFAIADIARLSQNATFAGSVNLTGGFQISSAAPVGKIPIGDGTNYVPGDPLVQGTQAEGSTTAANPINVGGFNTAGTPVLHGVNAINGAPGGTEYGFVTRNVPSGTQNVSVTNSPSVGQSGAPWSMTISGTPAVTIAQSNITSDYDTGAGTQNLTMFGLALPASGGAVAGGTATNPIRIDPTGTTTQPVSGSVSISGTPSVSISGTPTVTANAGTGTFNIQSNASINFNQLAGTAVDVNSGLKSAGTLRVVLATDQPQLTNKLLVTPDANSSVNVNQIGGGAVSTVATGVQKIGIADSSGSAFLSAANALNSTGAGLQAAQIIGQFDDTSPTAITENQFGNLRMSANRNIYGTIRDAAGNERGANVNASNELLVALSTVPTHAVTQSSGPWTQNITQWGSNAVLTGGTNGSVGVGGLAASGATVSGNPVLLGGRAQNAEQTAVTNGQAVSGAFDLVGKQIVVPYANPENFVSGAITTAMTGTTSTSLIGAPAAGLRNYITQITVSNAHATVGTDIIIQDGSGGTTLYTIPASAVYGGAAVTFPTPLRQPTTATAIFCANVTTGASTKVSASGYKGQ